MKRALKGKLAILLALVLVVSLFAGCGGNKGSAPTETTTPATETKQTETTQQEATQEETKEEKLSMVMITDAGGLGDKGFNDIVWKGLEKARDQLGYEIAVIESSEAAQYGPNIAAAAEQGYDIVVCVGYLFTDILPQIAPQYPETRFVMIDGAVEGDNVYSYKFELQQAGFLAGALAGLKSESNKFGVVGGMEIPEVVAWASGFAAGVKTTRPDGEVNFTYVGSFGDPGKAKELALTHFSNGADICMEITSGGAIGVIEAARDANKMFIATDSSKDALAPGHEFTAALAKRDEAVFAVAKMIKEGSAKPGITYLSMKDGIFGLPDNTEERYGSEAAQTIKKLQDMILSGELVVPKTVEELQSYVPPALN